MTNEEKFIAITNPELYIIYMLTMINGPKDINYILDNLADFYTIRAYFNNMDEYTKADYMQFYKNRINDYTYKEKINHIRKSIITSSHSHIEELLIGLKNECKFLSANTTIFKALVDIFGKNIINNF